MTGNYDHYVWFVDPRSGVMGSIRCAGLATAEAIAAQKRQLGFDKVQIIHKRASRKKDQSSYVSHGSVSIPFWRGRAH